MVRDRYRPDRPLRVAWVGPYDIEGVAHRIPQDFSSRFHPATCSRNNALALARRADVELHILMHDKRFRRDYAFDDGGIRFHLFHAPLPVVPRPVVWYRLDRWKYHRALAEIQPDLVHGHGTENAYSYVTVTSGLTHVISIWAIIRDLVRQHRKLTRRRLEHLFVRHIERYTVRRAANVIVEAPFAEAFVRSLNGRARVFLLENVVHEAYFAVERDPQAPKTSITFVGSILETKGVEDLIRAFHVLSPRHPSVTLDLFGAGVGTYQRDIVEPLASDGPGAARISFRGQQPAAAIAEHLRTAAMLVLPSYFDTSPNVVAEAMVAGVPVVATRVGGIPFMVRSGETGQLVPLGDDRALVDAVALYLERPELARAHGHRAREEGRTRWAEARYVDRLLGIYREVVGEARGMR